VKVHSDIEIGQIFGVSRQTVAYQRKRFKIKARVRDLPDSLEEKILQYADDPSISKNEISRRLKISVGKVVNTLNRNNKVNVYRNERVNEGKAEEIKRLRLQGLTYFQVANKLGCSFSSVVITDKTYNGKYDIPKKGSQKKVSVKSEEKDLSINKFFELAFKELINTPVLRDLQTLPLKERLECLVAAHGLLKNMYQAKNGGEE